MREPAHASGAPFGSRASATKQLQCVSDPIHHTQMENLGVKYSKKGMEQCCLTGPGLRPCVDRRLRSGAQSVLTISPRDGRVLCVLHAAISMIAELF